MFYLVGLPEGLAGVSEVKAESLEEVFETFPVLNLVRDKLEIHRNRIIGFVACDG